MSSGSAPAQNRAWISSKKPARQSVASCTISASERRADKTGMEASLGWMDDFQSQHVPMRSKRRAFIGIFALTEADFCARVPALIALFLALSRCIDDLLISNMPTGRDVTENKIHLNHPNVRPQAERILRNTSLHNPNNPEPDPLKSLVLHRPGIRELLLNGDRRRRECRTCPAKPCYSGMSPGMKHGPYCASHRGCLQFVKILPAER